MPAKPSLLRSYRLARKLTPAEFAEQLGIPERTLRSLENGWRPITAERAKAIEQKTSGRLTRIDLRPDLFSDLPRRRREALA